MRRLRPVAFLAIRLVVPLLVINPGSAGATIQITPTAPADVIAQTGGFDEAVVSWEAPDPDGGATFSVSSTPSSGIHSAGTSSRLEINGLDGGATYVFFVAATVSGRESLTSAPSNPIIILDASPSANAWAWGNGDNGQLGNGYSGENPQADSCDGESTAIGNGYCSSLPVRVTRLSNVEAIVGDSSDGYALRSDGTVWAWGDGSYGALGNGYSGDDHPKDSCDGETDNNEPVRVNPSGTDISIIT